MTPKSLMHDDVKDLVEAQLAVWPLAKKNYDALANVERKPFRIGKFYGAVQCNPARIVSTGAATDADSIAKRPCFLCASNRPKEQIVTDIIPDWDVLVNPFPILPIHLTIVSKTHQPQTAPPLEMVNFAEALPGMAVFFNGAKAGASAPDHLHLQAVLKDELPIIRFIEEHHKSSMTPYMSSVQLSDDFPFFFFSGIVTPDSKGLETLRMPFAVGGLSQKKDLSDISLTNVIFWIDNDRMLRFVQIPRRKHRPSCYYLEGKDKRVISPGTIDMAGLIIAPRKEDFEALDARQINEIYKETALDPAMVL